jgi:hypothetical protein
MLGRLRSEGLVVLGSVAPCETDSIGEIARRKYIDGVTIGDADDLLSTSAISLDHYMAFKSDNCLWTGPLSFCCCPDAVTLIDRPGSPNANNDIYFGTFRLSLMVRV